MDKHFKGTDVKNLFEDAVKQPGFQKTYGQFKPLFEVQNLIIEEKIKKGLSSKQLAAQIGITQSEFRKLEEADERITLKSILMIVEYFGKWLDISLNE